MAEQGDYFVGWIEVADSAGHVMEGGGSMAEPMFHVQLNTNSAPSLSASYLGWANGGHHPSSTLTSGMRFAFCLGAKRNL